MVADYKILNEEADHLAKQLFGDDIKKRTGFSSRLMDICSKASGKDFLLIHNPGGWGSTDMKGLLLWERSIIEGVSATIGKLGYQCSLMQYFRSDHGWRAVLGDVREQSRFFSSKAKTMAAELEFVTRHFDTLRVIMIGVSQGAAFSNAVAQNINGENRVFSIEMGIPFPYKSRRVITKRTLALDSNGLMPDALMDWNVPTIFRTYLTAPFRWMKFRMRGKRVKFTYCINVPGHDYNWDYPEVQHKIENFLNSNFSNKGNMEGKGK
ncbi:MAG: hypothetical protein AABZ77_09415 [Chloroflexota bacterium]